MNLRSTWAVILLLLLAGLAQASDTLRCNSTLVSVNDNMSTVLRKCGEPSGRGPTGYVWATDPHGRPASLPVEQWTYGPTNGIYHYLRFKGERLVSISSERG
jgi:hypothetical protein